MTTRPLLRRYLSIRGCCLLALGAWAVGLAAMPATATAADGVGVWPLAPAPGVHRGFDPPTSQWGSGHRGVDLVGRLGQPVRSALPGRVSFVGKLAGRGVVTVNHGGTRMTYEPVRAFVSVGDQVSAGQTLGLLTAVQSHCAPSACLHWGWIANSDDSYLDPLSTVGGTAPVRLLPLWGEAARQRSAAVAATMTGAGLGRGGSGTRVSPVATYVITNTFGKAASYYASGHHTGLDFAAPTGTPIRSVAAGTVIASGWGGAYGRLTKIAHGDGVETWYTHQSGQAVRPGQRVRAGQVIGSVGSTGNSTGPHLHLEVRKHGTPIDPAAFLR